jgi:hypothetical protein
MTGAVPIGGPTGLDVVRLSTLDIERQQQPVVDAFTVAPR